MVTELRARARAIRRRVLATHTEARQLRTVLVPLRRQIVEETLKQYNAMNASTFELLDVRGDLVETDRQYVDALRRYWRAEAEARALRRGALPGIPAPPTGSATATRDERLTPQPQPIFALP
jgi:outer membrane protein TolC